MDTDKTRFSFRWMPRSVDDVASGNYIGDTIRCTDGHGTELIFTIREKDKVEFTKCKGVASDGRVTIPSIIPFLFRHEENELRISFRVVSIGERAFYFYNCSSLKEISIPDSVITIGDEAFYRCSFLKRIIIPTSVTSIGSRVFSGCASLAKIVIPDSVRSIGRWAFDGCESLKEITVDGNNPVYDSRDNCNAIIETVSGRLIR